MVELVGCSELQAMNDKQRFKLHFGPYKSPRFKYGDVVWDKARGCEVRIIRLSSGPIPWPIGKVVRGNGGRPSLILYDCLIRAVQNESNQAVAHWWGTSGYSVSKWRKVFGLLPTTEGTSRLRSAHALEPPISRGRAKAHAMSRNPVKDAERRAKIAVARIGKKRPQHVMEIVRKANLGRSLPTEVRRKMSEAHQRRGTRPPWLNPAWSPREDQLLRTLRPADAARRTKRSLSAVYGRRNLLGISDGRTTRHLAAYGRAAGK